MQEFRKSSEATLALVADSGIGKTCCLCYRAIQLLDAGQPVLFLRGSELEQRLLDRLAEEFAWTFSETLSPPALVKRLSQVVGEGSLLVFLDAIDEWPEENVYRQLGSLTKHLSGSGVKLVVSCKTSTWSSFTEHLDTPTDFAASLPEHDGRPGVVVGPLTETEFYDALGRYKEVYGFKGVWDEKLYEEAKRSPFFMRIAFEVAKEYGLHELRESTREIFDRYYHRCLERTQAQDRRFSDRVLVGTAEALFETNAGQVENTRP